MKTYVDRIEQELIHSYTIFMILLQCIFMEYMRTKGISLFDGYYSLVDTENWINAI